MNLPKEAPCWCDGVPPLKVLQPLPCADCGAMNETTVAHLLVHDCEADEWLAIRFPPDLCPAHDVLPNLSKDLWE